MIPEIETNPPAAVSSDGDGNAENTLIQDTTSKSNNSNGGQ